MADKPGMLSSLLEEFEIARKLGGLQIRLDVDKCTGVYQCYEVCPIGCWTPDRPNRVVILHDEDLCIACGACVLQCPEGAITLE